MWKMGPAPRQKNHDTSMDGLAIVIRGNKATKNVSTGDLVLVENSTISGVSDGGYKALSSVSAGTAFTSANLSALSKGAVNALSDQIANIIKTNNYSSSNLAITTSYSSGAMYYADIDLDQYYFGDIKEIISLTLFDYGGLQDTLMFQVVTRSKIRVWSKTSQTLTTISIKILYFPY